jgi:hypothetical protein
MRTVGLRTAVALAALMILSSTARPAAGMSPFTDQPAPVKALLWLGSAAVTPPYAVLKSALAVGGTAAAAWILALSFDPGAAGYILRRSVSGDWWVQPAHLTRERALEPIPSIGGGEASGRTLGGYPIE